MVARPRFATGPSGAAVLRGLRAKLASGWKPGLTVLTGDDVFHLDQAQRALLAHLVPENASQFALTIFGEQKVAVADVVAAARSMPMFAERRVVLVRDVLVLEGEEATLVAYAAAPPERSFLLIRALKLDLRRALHKAVAGAGTLLDFRSASDPVENQREIEALARDRGLTLDREVVSLLLEISAGELHRVAMELDKIVAWLGPDGGRRVTLDAAREIAASGGTWTGWEIANALMDRDEKAAVLAVRQLVDSGEEPLRLLGGLAFRVRALLQAKALVESGRSLGEILSIVRAGGSPGTLERSLRRYSLAELSAFPGRLLEADRCLKSRSLDPRAVLESLVVTLTRAPADAGLERS